MGENLYLIIKEIQQISVKFYLGEVDINSMHMHAEKNS